jgi:hypothetical protein
MKKIFTLFFALFTLAFYANAQVPIFSENFDSGMPAGWTQIDANNDGYNWEHSSNPVSYFVAGTDLSGSGHDGSTGFILSGSYSNVTNQAITPDNWLITPAITLTAASNLSFWVCAQDASYAQEHYGVYISTTNNTSTSDFTLLYEATIGGGRVQTAWENHIINLASYTGQTVYIAFRHFNCNDMFVLNLDDVEVVAQPTEPTIVADPTAIDFGSISLTSPVTATASITAYNLTAGITATTAAPFEVSADGTTYAATATIAQAGGTLYVKYAPTVGGTDNGTVTLTSGTATASIALTGNAIDCSNAPVPYYTDFTNDAMNQCWTIVDANNDTNTFEFSSYGYAIYLYSETNNANDWLISPVFQLGNTAIVAFDYATNGPTEKFSVYVIGAGQTYANATLVLPTQSVSNTSWETQYVDLSAFANQSVQVAIKCESDADNYAFGINEFNVLDVVPSSMELSTYSIDYGVLPSGSTLTAMVGIATVNVNEAITVATAAPYGVSLDGTTFTPSVTIPANAELAVIDTVYVQFAPTAAGSFNDLVIVSTTTLADTIELTGISIECNVVTTFPFTEDFEETSTTAACWLIQDANEDGRTFSISGGVARYQYSSSNTADDWLISPEMTFTGTQIASFEYWAQSYSYPERFMVAAINGTTVTPLTGNIDVTSTTHETQYVDLSSLTGNYRIGIHCISDPDEYYLNIDNFTVSDAAVASISATPEILYFNSQAGVASASKEVVINGIGLNDDITVSTTAPFEVSTDNNTFSASVTIAVTEVITEESIYVRYNPTAAGTHNGTVTLTSGSANATVTLEGTAVDCSTPETLPYVEDFENGLSDCWTLVDADGDGYNWMTQEIFEGHSGLCISSASWISGTGALTPDNWMITPAINLSAPATLTFWANAQDAAYPAEHYGVYISTTGVNPTDFTLLFEETMDENGGPRIQGAWKQKSCNLSAYAGQTVHIAFRHFNCTDMFWLNIDDLEISEGAGIETVEHNAVKVFPNPANSYINVNANSNISNVEIYSISGQKVADFTANGTQTVISTSNLSNGMYLMKINTENGTINKKFSVVR